MAACAHILGQNSTGPDAAAQIREIVRLADGHIRVAFELLNCIPETMFAEFALIKGNEVDGKIMLETSTTHPFFETVPELKQALKIDPEPRRRAHPEPASSFLHRLSPHNRFISDGQKVALHALMMMPKGASLVVALPTGWGKSALFQVGIRHWRELDPTATIVVIVPTIALAQDHARTLETMPGLEACTALVGGTKQSSRREILGAFINGDIPILLVSPEMALGGAYQTICDSANRASRGFEGAHLSAIVVDEAHIIASWGRYFRPDFQRLPGLVKELQDLQPDLRTLLLSATIDADQRRRLREQFAGSNQIEEVVVAEPRDEFDIVWKYLPSGNQRFEIVTQAVDIIPRPAIIYTTTVEDAERLYAKLNNRGYRRVELFTGEITDPNDRQRVIDSWARGNVDLVVATSAFGMGVDKADVRAIVHVCLPESADRFYQEIGRGGRDGHQALSFCLWNDQDAMIAANLAIHGWMRPETSIRRWKAILKHANQKELFSHGPSGELFLKVLLDARHEGLDRITGNLNRQWNAALLTLLQRSGALRIIKEKRDDNGSEYWVAEILQPTIVDNQLDLDQVLKPYLSVGESEAIDARRKSIELERAMRNKEEGCFRTMLFDIVEPGGSPWPCGRCPICVETSEHPRSCPDRHEFNIAWSENKWTRSCPVIGVPWVVNLEEPTLRSNLHGLVALMSRIGIEQFIVNAEMIDDLEQAVCESRANLGFTLILGGDVPPARMPTAVLLANGGGDPETTRKHCMKLRQLFENNWKEIPILFLLSPDLGGSGAVLSQHLSSQAPMTEKDLSIIGSET